MAARHEGGGASRTILFGSVALNLLLLLALMARQQLDISLSVTQKAASPANSWCPPRPTALAGDAAMAAAAASASSAAAASLAPPPPPSLLSASSSSSARYAISFAIPVKDALRL